MNIQKLKILNFRGISSLDLELDDTNRVICFVGENGSAKTSVLGLISEAIVSKTKLIFPNFDPTSSKLRYRLVAPADIKKDSKFYSSEIHYFDIKSKKYEFKKLVGEKGLDPSLYTDSIQGINLNNNFHSEFSSLQNLTEEEDFLYKNVFLIRPSQRYELDPMDKDTYENELSFTMKSRTSGHVPYSFSITHSGKGVEELILDMYFDSIIGYTDARDGFNKISQILTKITGKNFGFLQISQSPYRELHLSEIGKIKSLSQGELDLLVTITSIISQQLFIFKQYSPDERTEFNFDTIFKIPGIVIIDEVDLHLHPKAQEQYLKVLVELFPNIQYIVATHSPFVIRGLPKNSKVINLPAGNVFNENFSAMDIDSITNIIFNYDGGFSADVKTQLSLFKNILVSEEPNITEIKSLYDELSSSNSAKDELDLLLASYADEGIITAIKGN